MCSEFAIRASLFVGWHELLGGLQGLALLELDALVASLSTDLGGLVGSTEDVVSLDSAVVAAVAWDWVAKGEASLLCLHAIEDLSGVVKRLGGWLSVWKTVVGLGVEGSGVGLELLISHDIIGSVGTVELIDRAWWNWLGRKNTEQSRLQSVTVRFKLCFSS